MSDLDWGIMLSSLLFIVVYGIYKTARTTGTAEAYLKGDGQAKWFTVGLSVMATQASAITFLSTPGQAYHDGLGFVQFYFGLPLAMVVICVTFIPIYHKLKVYTAYEFLENRFDLKTRSLAASLFLIQRGLAAGITIYAPAIILSSILGWNLNNLNIIIGLVVIVYTVSGGTKAVSVTQKQQMAVIFAGMVIAFFMILSYLPENVGFLDAMHIAGANQKTNVLDFSFDPKNKYTFWSGITGGFFLALAYFGTDQSQVQRYLTTSSVKQSRMGLVMNGLLKVPMQFFILLTGVMVFVFYQYNQAPVFFNPVMEQVKTSEYAETYQEIETEYTKVFEAKKGIYEQMGASGDYGNSQATTQLFALNEQERVLRNDAKQLALAIDDTIEENDKDFVFITFILDHLPKGLIGLLLAMILSAAMSSTASELNSLGTTTSVDIYKRSIAPGKSDRHYLLMSRLLTLMWGVIAIVIACYASLFDNLIQFVNIIGSIFYGTVLGIFVVAFYFKSIKGRAVFAAAVITQATIIYIFWLDKIGYLWLNFIGCALVIILGLIFQETIGRKQLEK